jgi:hypothetical protein
MPVVTDPQQVINLSTLTLTEEQTHVLSLGPKFCPTPTSISKLTLNEDTTEGMRKIRLKEFWFNEDTPAQISTKPPFYKQTFFCPRSGRDKGLDAYCSAITTRVKSFQPQPLKKRNVSRKTKCAIQELQQLVQERRIRIVPADKGGAVVVQDFLDYKAEAFRQLTDDRTYEPVAEDPTQEIAKKSNEYMNQLQNGGHINENTFKWGTLNTKEVKCHTFYHLPKVHKNKENPPGRPIVSGIGGPTEKLSKLVDFWLQPMVRQLPSFVQDTTHFLRMIEDWKVKYEPLPKDTLLVTIDVVGLYTNIPHEQVGESIKAALIKFKDSENPIPPLDLLRNIVDHVLQNNVFDFDGHKFKQKFGTAMGTPMAPSIANLFMAWIEHQIRANSPWKIQEQDWKRFIDDIAMIWFHGEENLLKFLEWMNNIHPTIKFTANYGTTNIPFLDVNMSIKDSRITTDLHVKKTDANMCLPFQSCHPRHCARSIPYSQCLRLRRICSSDALFAKRANELKEKLNKRGYPIKILQEAISRVSTIDRKDTLEYKQKSTTKRVPIIITHNPGNPPLAKWLKEYMPLLHSSSRMKKAAPEPPIVGERNCRNLRSILMPSKLPQQKHASATPSDQTGISAAPNTHSTTIRIAQTATKQLQSTDSNQEELSKHHNTDRGCYKCKATRCVLCTHHMQETREFRSTVNGTKYQIRDKLDCTSSNIVYLIDCKKCGKAQYVGESGQTLKKRFYGHTYNIRHFDPATYTDPTSATENANKQETLVAKHFNSEGHSIMDMQCTAIEQIRKLDPKLRKRREKFWRHQLQSNWPDGLNVFD